MLYLLNPMQGRIGRGHWWLLQLIIFALAFAGLILSIMVLADRGASFGARNANEEAMLVFVIVAVVYMNFCTCLNRLRDSGRSGFWYLTFLLPYAGTGLMLYFCGFEASNTIDRTSRQQHKPIKPMPEPQPAPPVERRTNTASKPVFGRR